MLIFSFIWFFSNSERSFSISERKIAKITELEDEINQSESQYNDITSGTEKKIVWYAEAKTKTKISVVYIHGFSASRQEVSPLTENIAKALGANIYLTRLIGHGRVGDAMGQISVDQMLADAAEAIDVGEQIGERVIVIGMSTGATLATWLSVKKKSNSLAALVLLSPNYGLADPKSKLLLLPAAKYWLPLVEGRTYQFKPDNEQQAKFWSWKYPTVALIPMMELVDSISGLALETMSVPVLVLYSKEDKVVDVSKITQQFERMGSVHKEIDIVRGTEGSQHHVLAGDILSPGTTSAVETRIISFINKL